MEVSAYTKDDKLVEGKLRVLSNGQKVVLTESGKVKLDELKCVRFFEEEDTNPIDKQVQSDISVIKDDLEKKLPKEDELEKAGEEREKELNTAGLKGEKDEYKTKFVLQASAIVDGAGGGVDTEQTDANKSEAFKAFKEADEDSAIHIDYQTAEPYQDSLTRDQIYLKMKQEIDDYQKANDDQFDEKELVERMCRNLVGFDCVGEFKNLKEAFIKIRKNVKLV